MIVRYKNLVFKINSNKLSAHYRTEFIGSFSDYRKLTIKLTVRTIIFITAYSRRIRYK